MDDFGVLVKNYGINPKGKSAPMAASRKASQTHKNSDSVNQDPNFFSESFSASNSGNGSFFDDQNDDIFGFKSSNKVESYVTRDVFDDVFQMPSKNSGFSNGSGGGGGFDFDVESVLKGSKKGSKNSSGNSKCLDGNGDDIWGFYDKSGSSNVDVGDGDLLSSDPVDDFWGKMAKLDLEQKGVKRLEENEGNGDVLIPGFEVFINVNNRSQNSAKEKAPSVSSLEELEKFASQGINKDVNGHGGHFTAKCKGEPTKTVKHQQRETNFFDVDVSTYGDSGDSVHQEKMQMADIMFQTEASDLDLFFSAHAKKSTPISEEPVVIMKTCEEPNLFSRTGFGMDKKVSPRYFPGFHSMFEGSSESGVFQEIEGESDERRSLRFARHQRAKQRMKHALAEMNQREFNAQQEQQEKHRIADTMEMEMKGWAAGKEGNLRALLSSLQQVLGPEFGWKPVSLTDLITSSQVKIAYKKAALCIHPDKVQQRGANLQQKYVAEKSFDLLKEAWNKFSTEELR